MSRFRRRSALAGLVLLGAAAATVAGCGAAGGDLANGKTQFVGACGGCHTLADAGTTGTVGPNLDDAFRGAREQDFKQSTFEGVVRYWIEGAEQRTQPVMPRNLVTGQDADDVAAYVAAVAGRDPESPPRPQEPTQ